MLLHLRPAILFICLLLTANLAAQQGPGTPSGQYSGPNVLSRWSRQQNNGRVAPTSARFFLFGSYTYLDGLTGPAFDQTDGRNLNGERSQNIMGGGGVTLTHVNSRSAVSLSYLGNYTGSYSASTNAYRGSNQDLNLNYERQLTRRWGFYTGHTAGNQSTILGLARPVSGQRNFFDQTYAATNEVLDVRLRFLNSGAGLYYQRSSRLSFSMDGGVFVVSRNSNALASSRGERAQGEISYRTSRRQAVGVQYSYSHFFYPRGFGESYIHTVMVTTTRQVNTAWTVTLAAGPYESDNERLRTVAVDPYIASIIGQATTITAFSAKRRGLSINVTASGNYRRQSVSFGYRRAVDPGNGVTLTALTDVAQAGYNYQTTRKLSVGAGMFVTRMDPLLEGTQGSARFRSEGGTGNINYRLHSTVYLTCSAGVQRVNYQQFGFALTRKLVTLGLAFSPSELPLHR